MEGVEPPFPIGIIGAVVMVVGVIALVRVVNCVWVRPKRLETFLTQQNLRGNCYRFVYGDSKEMGKMIQQANSKPIHLDDDILPRILPFHHQIIRNYGKSSFFWHGPTPVVTIINPEEIREVMNNISIFQKPLNNPLVQLLITGLIEYNGEKWIKHRKIVNPAFHLEKLKLMLPTFYECCNEMVEKWKRLVSESENGSLEIDVWPFFHTLSGDAISRTAFGSNYEEGKRILQLQTQLAHLTGNVLRSVYIPGWRFVPTKLNRKMKEVENEIQVLLRGIIHKREKAKEAGEAPSDDLLGILLESNRREIQDRGNKKKFGMSIDEVIKECKLFYLAGQETTSVLLNWTIVLLSKFPNWQAKAREEVLQVFGTQKPDYDALNRLKVLTMILYEVLRLYPPAPLIPRLVSKETKLGNLKLPRGVRVWIPVILVHQDPQLWGEDAKEFKPERFSEGVYKAAKSQACFLPFGWGPRICIGQNFALIEAKMAISLILQNFSFQLSSSYAHAPFIDSLTLQPQFGTHIIFNKL
ncbi:cytochrome P450 CYP72A219-like [Senna tora]|uniref:Cytochrome P450 CYP72A219-like n=1 Tax=Senna tora TaxID=362788 RepID=A0A834TJQ7_9FABA|nr:cytochrome P450 CYP72A219-like [Senna tora]